MSFGFLSLPTYVSLCIITSFYFACLTIRKRNIDRKAHILLYLTLSIGGVLIAVIKILNVTTNIHNKFFDKTGYLILVYLAILIVEIFYISMTSVKNSIDKKRVVFIWSIVFICIFLMIIIVMMP